jgi:hypothetical protein
MKIFLSYASQDREPAHSIYLALRDQDIKYFLTAPTCRRVRSFTIASARRSRIRSFFLFLISPNAIDAGSYTLTELDIAGKANVRWLPVALGKLDVGSCPLR